MTSGQAKRPRGSLLRWSLFLAAVFLFCSSLLSIVSAPTATLWVGAILAEEWGHYFALLALIVAALSWRRDGFGALTTLLAFAAFLLFGSPSVRAAMLGNSLAKDCDAVFGPAANAGEPFRFIRLFRGVSISKVHVRERIYGTDGNKQLKLDLYRSQSAGERALPLILVVHGGSWHGGNKEQLTTLNRYLAHQGYEVAALNYRHAPKWQFPAAVDDIFRALEYLKTHASEFHLDPTHVVLLGRSAGGQIALSAAYAKRDPGIRGVISFYGPTDLVLGYEHPSRRSVLDSKQVLEDYLGGSPTEKPEAYAAGSAVNFVGPETPPTLLIHGQLDPIVWPEQSALLHARLTSAGRPNLYLSLPWATHGCDANLNGPSGQLSRYAIDRFLTHLLQPEPAE